MEKGYGKPPKNKQFTKDNQPTFEARSKGQRRRFDALKFGDEFMVLVTKYSKKSLKRLKELLKDKDELRMRDYKAIIYVTKEKYLLDMMNRTIPNAPVKIETENVNTNIDLSKLSEKELKTLDKLTGKIDESTIE